MRRIVQFGIQSFFLLSTIVVGGQVVESFEGFGLSATEFLNNAGASGTFATDYIALPNSFNEEFQFWSGWSISAATDTETPGFTNQYSAIAGGGANGTSSYAVSFVGGESLIAFPNK
nr:DUF4465 domain-containing protein [Saprospiraceae bacterium]